MILIKAPYDDKNLMTDFLIDDFKGINNYGNIWLMFIEDQPVMCTIMENRLHFKVLGYDKAGVLDYLKQYFETTEEIKHEFRVVGNSIIITSYFIKY